MECPFVLPARKPEHADYLGNYLVLDAKDRVIVRDLTSDEADYIVQAINCYEKLVNENRQLKEQPRCRCGGELEGLGFDIKTKNAVYECKKCQAQIIFEQALKEKP